MKSLNPLNWFKSSGPTTWVQVDPDWPHQGFALFSSSPSTFACALGIKGITEEEAKRQLMGKVLAFDRLSGEQRAALWDKSLKVNHEKLKGMLR